MYYLIECEIGEVTLPIILIVKYGRGTEVLVLIPRIHHNSHQS